MIVDIHQHLGWMPLASAAENSSLQENRRLRVEFMDRWQIDQAFILPSNAVAAPKGLADRRRANDLTAEYVALQPDRFVAGFGTVHPADGEGGLAEVTRCIRDLGLRGIVWHHHFLGTAIDHPGMDDLLSLLEELDVPAFVHIVAESALEAPWRLEGIAERHPGVRFVALDGFSSFSQASWITQIAQRRPNIYFDTGMMASVAHHVDKFIATVGADRLLLGTDFYCEPHLFGLPFPLEEIRHHLGLADDVTAKVLGGNAHSLLGLAN